MNDPAPRPDPDALLALARREGRGRLKVFLGAAPGVGKTWEMLAEARRRQAGGADILVGLVETHGRAETAAQLSGLTLLPRAHLAHRGQMLEEFDLDAALAARPQILLLDELAHSNAPGSRHPKRWQDVEELREAGIEVWTTMNVQHLESLSDAVARITGVRVAETVPDAVLAGADAVELIDIPPGELLERLRQGKIYRAEQVPRALRGFFREGNLAALRELALRRTAERVDADVTSYMRANAIAGPWPSGERVLALVGADPAAESVVRHAARIAEALRAPLLALHVERPTAPGDAGRAAAALRLAESLGAEVETIVATDLPAALLAAARARNAGHLVIGRGRPPAWRRLAGRTLSAALLRRGGDFALHLVPDPAAPRPAAPSPAAGLPRWLGWSAAPLLAGAASLVAAALDGEVPEGVLGMLYLPALVASAVIGGALPGLLAAALGFLAWNFLFLPPRYTLVIAGPQDVVGAVVFILVALLLAGTTGGLGRSVRAAQARLLGLRRLVEFSRRLGATRERGDLLEAVAREAERLTHGPVCVLTPLPPAPGETMPEPVPRAALPLEAVPDAAGMAAARWALAHGRPTGRGTDTLPAGTDWQFRPMRTARATAGLLGLKPEHGLPDAETDRALDALLDQAAVALERLELMEERARAAARAESESLRSALLTSLGHDLKTPLTSVRGAIGTLRVAGAALSPEQRDDLLATAEEEAERLSRWIANILDIVRIENGEVRVRAEPVDLAEAAEAAARRITRASGRAIGVEAGERLRLARLDPLLLDQVLGNLLDNAVKFSGPGGRVVLRLWRDGAEMAVAVEDDGPGIPPADLPRIFDPFFRASRTDRVAAGSGLGLAISRGLVQAMGGRIAAESPLAAGRGTRITARFPA
ncbi:sensor histidine kinase KdpD [Pseudoroseomonas cervicalis]|uniref:sensor histidine kinase n=1 Tax=Teichococcus cervicalis TaxID=204525 RepID=UPI0022F176AD|nr:sensor histidine kinase KdpD [Pseudoroseomonas cervicalis]WBV45445.1 sensor histidine kinase KdpD [Pseudoroseomonas cervicalis]